MMNELTFHLLLVGGLLSLAVVVGLPIWSTLIRQWQQNDTERRCLGPASLGLGMTLAPLVLLLAPPLSQARSTEPPGDAAEVSQPDSPSEATEDDAPAVPAELRPDNTDRGESSDTSASDTAASDTAASDTAASDTAASDTAASEIEAVEIEASEPKVEDVKGSDRGLFPARERPELPDWVESRSVREGSLHRQPVHSDYHATERDSWRALDDQLRLATTEYIAEYLNDPNSPLFVDYSLQEIKSRLLKPENVHHEIREFGFGIMHQTHALLEFPPEFRRELDRRWHQVTHTGRVLMTGGAFLGVILLLSLFFGYLRLEQRTRGSFSTRLPFVAAAAILAIVLAGTLWTGSHATWIQWLLSHDLR